MNFIISIFWNRDERRLRAGWRLLVFLVVAGVLSLATALLPEGTDLALAYTVAMLLTVFGAWLVGRFVDRRDFADFGFRLSRAWWRDFGFGIALGAVLMGAIFLVEYLAGWISITGTLYAGTGSRPFALAIFSPLLLFLSVGIYEELLYRGYLLKNLSEGFNIGRFGEHNAIVLAVLLTSVLFGLGHLANPNTTWVSTLNISVAGVFLSLGYLMTRELALPIGLHISWNFFQGNVFGFPVSGMSLDSASFITVKQGGPAAWTGGNFGPEAGLLGLFAMLAGTGLILWWTGRNGYGRMDARLAHAPVQSQPARVPDVETEPATS